MPGNARTQFPDLLGELARTPPGDADGEADERAIAGEGRGLNLNHQVKLSLTDWSANPECRAFGACYWRLSPQTLPVH